MTFEEKFTSFKPVIYNLVGNFFTKFAELFGYPTNQGMPVSRDLFDQSEIETRSKLLANLPKHQTFWPSLDHPQTFLEVIFGSVPKLNPIPRYLYENKEEGFYNFYVENYKNLYFLPDWFSEFLQVRLNICLDITVLEIIREIIFVGLAIYSQLLFIRIALSWFIMINPYTFPWVYLAGLTDWTEEILQGIVPSILGINVTGTIFLGLLGITADNLNHLVFTMPFLPSEGETGRLVINGTPKDIIVFHYLPILWYRYGIPNEIRLSWLTERSDILAYMLKNYSSLKIALFPDELLIPMLKYYSEISNGAEIISNANELEEIKNILTQSNLLMYL